MATFSASASSGALQVRLFRSTNVVVVGGETIRSPNRGGKTGDPFPQGVENHPISRHIGKGCDPHLRVHITLLVFPSVQVFTFKCFQVFISKCFQVFIFCFQVFVFNRAIQHRALVMSVANMQCACILKKNVSSTAERFNIDGMITDMRNDLLCIV